MKNLIQYREIQAEDRNVFFQLVDEFYHSDVVLHPIPRSHYLKTFTFILENRKFANAFLFFYEDEIAGYAQVSFAFSNEAGGLVLWVEEIYIRPEYQGKGIGSYFFRQVFEKYKDTVKRFRLEVEPDNEGAKGLYEYLGFSPLEYQPYFREQD